MWCCAVLCCVTVQSPPKQNRQMYVAVPVPSYAQYSTPYQYQPHSTAAGSAPPPLPPPPAPYAQLNYSQSSAQTQTQTQAQSLSPQRPPRARLAFGESSAPQLIMTSDALSAAAAAPQAYSMAGSIQSVSSPAPLKIYVRIKCLFTTD